MTVLTFQFWHEAWENAGRPTPCGGRGCGFPTAPCRSGLGILTLQYVVDLLNLLTGREPPFGMDAGARTRSDQGGRDMSPTIQGVLVLVATVARAS